MQSLSFKIWLLFLAALTLVFTSCRATNTPIQTIPNPSIRPLTNIKFEPNAARLERGRYLTEGVLQCFVCHTAFSANLTADPSGILSYYDESLFLQTLRTGNVKARKLSAVMPWVAIGKMTDDDLKSIFAYLKTRRPVQHIVDNTEPPTLAQNREVALKRLTARRGLTVSKIGRLPLEAL